jgi:hypothetical protein
MGRLGRSGTVSGSVLVFPPASGGNCRVINYTASGSYTRQSIFHKKHHNRSLTNRGMDGHSASSALSALSFFPPLLYCEFQSNDEPAHTVERVQTGVRIEKWILKVMKALAEYHDLTLGDLIEGIVLHAFDGKCALGTESLKLVAGLKNIYHLDLDASSSHKLIERKAGRKKRT